MNIGIVGSKVDPFHWGHRFLGERAVEQGKLDLCLYMPVGVPADSDHVLAPKEIRYEMTVAGTQRTDPRFGVSRLELDREGRSFMTDTLRLLIAQYGEQHNYFLVIGADRAPTLKNWHESDALVQLCSFLVANRAGDKDKVTDAWLKEVMPRGANARGITVPNLKISSTELRGKVKAGISIAELVPPPVHRIIVRTGIYRA